MWPERRREGPRWPLAGCLQAESTGGLLALRIGRLRQLLEEITRESGRGAPSSRAKSLRFDRMCVSTADTRDRDRGMPATPTQTGSDHHDHDRTETRNHRHSQALVA